MDAFDVPMDIWLYLFRYLSKDEIRTLSHICRYFRSVCSRVISNSFQKYHAATLIQKTFRWHCRFLLGEIGNIRDYRIDSCSYNSEKGSSETFPNAIGCYTGCKPKIKLHMDRSRQSKTITRYLYVCDKYDLPVNPSKIYRWHHRYYGNRISTQSKIPFMPLKNAMIRFEKNEKQMRNDHKPGKYYFRIPRLIAVCDLPLSSDTAEQIRKKLSPRYIVPELKKYSISKIMLALSFYFRGCEDQESVNGRGYHLQWPIKCIHRRNRAYFYTTNYGYKTFIEWFPTLEKRFGHLVKWYMG